MPNAAVPQPKLVPEDASPFACRVVAIYEDTPARAAVAELLERLGHRFTGLGTFGLSTWSFAGLRQPEARRKAMRDALSAPMIIVAANALREPPICVKGWFELWASCPAVAERALVVLFTHGHPWEGKDSPLNRYLLKVAAMGHMDYFSQFVPPVTSNGTPKIS